VQEENPEGQFDYGILLVLQIPLPSSLSAQDKKGSEFIGVP